MCVDTVPTFQMPPIMLISSFCFVFFEKIIKFAKVIYRTQDYIVGQEIEVSNRNLKLKIYE